MRLAGDILWLGIGAFLFAVIIGIVGWPLSAELTSRSPAAAAWGSSTTGVVPGTGESYTPPPPVYGTNRIVLSGASRTMADEIGEGSTSITPPKVRREIEFPLLDATADQVPNPILSGDGGLALTRYRPKPARSASAAAPASQPSPRSRHHQQGRPDALEEKSELVPW